MKLFINCIFTVLWLAFVIDVTKAETCTNSTVVDCCLCATEQCSDIDTCQEGLYKQERQSPTHGDLNCSSVLTTSTTPSVSSYTEGTSSTLQEETPSSERQNFTLCVTKCPIGFYGNIDTGLCEPCPEQCNECTLNDSCIKCALGFENISGTCSIPNSTTMTPEPKNNVAIIAGAVGGAAVVVIVLIIIVVVLLVRRRRSLKLARERKSFTDKSEAIQNRNPGMTFKEDDDEECSGDLEAGEGKPDHHIGDLCHTYENTAQINRQMTQHIQQGHDKVLRYTPDPTQSSLLKSNTANDDIALAQLPEAPAPPIASGRTANSSAARKNQSKRPTKMKKPEPISDDVYEPVGEGLPNSKDPADSDSEPGEEYVNEQVIVQFKKSKKVPSEPSPEEHLEDDYENGEVLGQLKAGSVPKQVKADDPSPEIDNPTRKPDYPTRKQDNSTRKPDDPTPEADDPEHVLEEYENETVLQNLRVPTKDPLIDDDLYQNFFVASNAKL